MIMKERKPVTPTTTLSADELIARGYRRTSNAWCLVSRIDRPDWVQHMAKEMRRPPADFYVPGEPNPSGHWCGHYRSVYSKDTHTVSHETIRLIPTSGHDPVGYVPVNGTEKTE